MNFGRNSYDENLPHLLNCGSNFAKIKLSIGISNRCDTRILYGSVRNAIRENWMWEIANFKSSLPGKFQSFAEKFMYVLI